MAKLVTSCGALRGAVGVTPASSIHLQLHRCKLHRVLHLREDQPLPATVLFNCSSCLAGLPGAGCRRRCSLDIVFGEVGGAREGVVTVLCCEAYQAGSAVAMPSQQRCRSTYGSASVLRVGFVHGKI